MSRDAFAVPGSSCTAPGATGRPTDAGADAFLLALPLVHRTLHHRSGAVVDDLPVPMLSGPRRSLWRLARAVVALEENASTGGPGPVGVDGMADRCREALEAALYGLDEPGVRLLTTALVARFVCLAGDRDLAHDVVAALAGAEGELVTVPGGTVVGPAGWFLAEVERLLGRNAAARRANAAAMQRSLERSDVRWVARCRLQRLRLDGLARTDELRPRPGADPAGPGHHGGGQQDDASEVSDWPDRSLPSPASTLSPRQLRVLALAATGMTNAQIAAELFLSVATVERHFTILYRTLGVRNRAGALGRFAELTAGGPAPDPTRR